MIKFYGGCHLFQGELGLFMEMAGLNLRKKISLSPLEPKEGLSLCLQLLESYESYTKNGWVHGDLKPENISFNENQLQLFDLGLAQSLDDSTQRHSPNDIQTITYRAPEVILGRRWDCSIDLWSIGGVVFFALFGSPPFDEPEDNFEGWNHYLTEVGKLLGPPSASFLKGCSEGDKHKKVIDQMRYSKREVDRFQKKIYDQTPQKWHKAVPYLIQLFHGIFRYELRISGAEAIEICKKGIQAIEN